VAAAAGPGAGDHGYPGIENFIGGSGDDTLTGDEGTNVLTGGPGRDTLSGLGGDDRFDPAGLFLPAGFPPVPSPSTDADLVSGGAGTDHVTYEARALEMTLSLEGLAGDGVAGENDNLGSDLETLTGGSAEDTLVGNARANVLHGGAGIVSDAIDGEGGIDTVSYQGRGSDLSITLDGSANDGAQGENDDVSADVENAWGGHGDDRMVGNSTRTRGPGLPPVFFGGNNELRGGSGDDAISGLGGNDILLGDGFPIAFLGSDDDSLFGGDGNDRLQGDTGAFGFFIRGSDSLQGGAGTDLADYSDRSGNLVLTLPDLTIGAPADDGEAGESDQLMGDIENLALGSGGDIATGNAAANVLDATTGGADTLAGAGGADTLLGGPLGDSLSGGPDSDAIVSGAGPGVTVTTIDGGDGDDLLTTGTGRDVVGGGTGVDRVTYASRAGRVNVTIGDGLANDGSPSTTQDDNVQGDVENVTGGPGADNLTGDADANVLEGGSGADVLTGAEGPDTLLGGSEDDRLKSVDSSADSDDCGAGAGDRVTKDALDTATDCELVAPAPTAPPSISGTLRDAELLTADPGTWSGTPAIAFAYQWRRCDAGGGACADIGGAAASTYALQPVDVGRTLRVRVTATNAADTAVAESAQTGQVEPAPPANGSPPSISGTPRDAELLAATPGTWAGTPAIAFAYQWRRCDAAGAACAGVAGATAQTYSLTPGDIGSTLRVRVTATNAAPDPVSAESAPTAEVEPAPPANTALPELSGNAREGDSVSATAGLWTGTPTIAFAYQWRRCDADTPDACSDIPGATAATYTPGPADVARRLRARVTATNAGGDATADSAPSRVVLPAGAPLPGEPGAPGPAPGPASPTPEPPDEAPPAMALALGGQSLEQVVKGGLVVSLNLSEAASVTARVELARRVARSLGIASRPVLVGRGRGERASAGRLRLIVRLNRRARRRLADAVRVRLTLRLAATDAAGNVSRSKRRVRLGP